MKGYISTQKVTGKRTSDKDAVNVQDVCYTSSIAIIFALFEETIEFFSGNSSFGIGLN